MHATNFQLNVHNQYQLNEHSQLPAESVQPILNRTYLTISEQNVQNWFSIEYAQGIFDRMRTINFQQNEQNQLSANFQPMFTTKFLTEWTPPTFSQPSTECTQPYFYRMYPTTFWLVYKPTFNRMSTIDVNRISTTNFKLNSHFLYVKGTHLDKVAQ